MSRMKFIKEATSLFFNKKDLRRDLRNELEYFLSD